jgi:hypothetical protein
MTMESDTLSYDHIHESMRKFADIPGRKRIGNCWNQIWVPTPSTRAAFIELNDCLNAAASTKPRGAIIVGEADTGKSRTMVEFRDRNCEKSKDPSYKNDSDGEYTEKPVVYIRAPDKPSRLAVYSKILAELGYPITYNPSEEALRLYTMRMINACQVKVILIDEMHDISRDTLSHQIVEFLRFLKNFINETGRPFVLAGVPVVLDLIASDTQIEGRFDNVIRLEALNESDFALIIAGFERMLPLRRPSQLRKNEPALRFVYDRCNGLIGRLSHFLEDACKIAIDTGEERITLEILERVPDRRIRTVGKR